MGTQNRYESKIIQVPSLYEIIKQHVSLSNVYINRFK